MLNEAEFPNIDYFEKLQCRINKKLKKINNLNDKEKEIVEKQIEKYQWLKGALGKPPSVEMFIAENPSITGIEHANVDTVDGEPPDIEAQWWGGKNNKAAKVFRPVLCELGLKTSPPDQKGGWNCYITNVIKQANYAKDHGEKLTEFRKEQEDYWSEILKWEIEKVAPKVLYCLGRRTEKAIKRLINEGRIQNIHFYYVRHYSSRGNLNDISEKMECQILKARDDLHRKNIIIIQ